MKLTDKQENAVYYLKDNQTTEIIYGGAAGGGKSALGCLWLMEQCQTYPGTRWLMGRAKLKTLKETTLNTFFEISGKLKLSSQFDYKEQAGLIKWRNGSEILLKDLFFYPADPEFDALGSLELTGAFVDEISQVTSKAWQAAKSRIRYKIDEYGLIPKMLGTCNPSKGWVYRTFYKPYTLGQLPSTRAFIRSLPNDNPHISETYLSLLESLDENAKQRLKYGNWDYDSDPTALITYDKIQSIWSNIYAEAGERYIICDVARFGSDKAVIMVWDGWRVIDIAVFPISKTTEIQDAINKMRVKHQVQLRNVIVDEDGVGGGVVDSLGCTGFVNNSKAFDPGYYNLKSEMGYSLSRNIQNIWFQCPVPEEYRDEIEQELGWLKSYDVDKDTKLRTMPKDKIKEGLGRSPDWLDCLTMRMYPKVKANVQYREVHTPNKRRI